MSEEMEKILSPEGVRLVFDSRETQKQMLENIGKVRPLEALPMWELEQMMRRDFLYAVQHPEYDGDGDDVELWAPSVIEKYVWRDAGPGPNGEAVKIEYPAHVMAPPPDEAALGSTISWTWLYDMAERAEKWAMEQVGDHNVWVGEDDLGRECRFISESDAGLQIALGQLGAIVRWNLRLLAAEIRHPDGTWHRIDDLIEASLRQMIAAVFSFPRRSHKSDQIRAVPANFTNAAWRTVLNAVLFGVQVDPFVQWLDTLEPWDGTPRIDQWLYKAGFVLDEEADGEQTQALIEWSARSMLMVACARARTPGLKHDTIPVLIGPQGTGKSTALAWLVPEEYRNQWFSDSLKLSAEEKRRVEALQGAVFVEVAEMTGATTADIESLKAFLSRTVDYIRLSYRTNPEGMPRRVSMAGTANGTAVLPNDPSGNRRFVALKITDGSVHAVRNYLDANRRQLWAEAWARTKAGEECWLPAELEAVQSAMNEQHRSADLILEDAVLEWLGAQAQKRVPGEEWFRIGECAKAIGMVKERESAESLSQRDVQRLSRVLTRYGCEPKRVSIDGKKTRVWLYPA